MKAIVFDCETTGRVEPRITEVAYVGYNTTREVEFNQRYNPEKPIELGAMAVTHICNEDLVDEPSYKTFQLPEGIEYIIGHNCDYDWEVIGKPDVKRIDTLAISRYLFPDLDSHSQSAMMYYFFGVEARKMVKEAHSALCDVINCRNLLNKLILRITALGNTIDSLEDLWLFSEKAKVPTYFTFGKHKGESLEEVAKTDKGWILWLLKQPDVDAYLRTALEKLV